MIKNWKITACLISPIAEKPPMLDAILAWELSKRLGMKHYNKLTRNVSLKEIQKVPIPIVERTIEKNNVYCCSDPIYECVFEWVEHRGKRIDTDLISLLLSPENRKSLLIASGPYKMRFAPVRTRMINKIVWFVRGDRKEINKLLKSVKSLGKHRSIGYGLIECWEYDEIEEDNSIFAFQNGNMILMRTVPFGYFLNRVKGYKKSFGAYQLPYWHPENYREIAIPC